jgi:hypothetical protein
MFGYLVATIQRKDAKTQRHKEKLFFLLLCAFASLVEPTLPQSRSFRGGLGKLSINSSALMVKNPEALQRRVLQKANTTLPKTYCQDC